MTPDEIEAHFTRTDGSYLCARWGRPIAPVVFGVDDATLSVVKGAIEAVAQLAGHEVVETDPELGANMMVFFFRDWSELLELPDLGRMIPDLEPLVARLVAADANQYRIFRFEPDGAIKSAFVFLRMDAHLSDVPAETLALSQAVQTILLWSDAAFQDRSPLALIPGKDVAVLRPEIGQLIRAAYDPILPRAAQDPAHALRLSARLTARES
ncbi:hypothetical protein SAMN05421666_2545 [Roseovarius nanhaiticus]|uniref:Uncharacterized protein n=1 Tax=Roseovarius nanhaiticus TaxID=573024 RepID=A0A1N7H5X5_9RHOB|nr:hypothetical protein [Roseovarius nanhaiticus]SEL11917.1 hypothetical protein SAMN05216208_2774 [Roseovarius nanhaiticus]SIS20183.1 hypothetical protein SAMN05421666_2545 [Roseovarius nanhaiticus]